MGQKWERGALHNERMGESSIILNTKITPIGIICYLEEKTNSTEQKKNIIDFYLGFSCKGSEMYQVLIIGWTSKLWQIW